MADNRVNNGWSRAKFGDFVRLVSDRTDPVAEGVERYVGLEHIEPNDLRVRSWGLVAEGVTFTNRFCPGHVLFGKRRAYQRKVALADFEGVCSGDILVLASANPDALRPDLLAFLCQTEDFFLHAVNTSAGSLSPRTSWASLAAHEFLLPPPSEQKQLAVALLAGQGAMDAQHEVSNSLRQLYRASSLSEFTRSGAVLSGRPATWAPVGWSHSELRSLVEPDAPISYGIVQPGDSVRDGVPTLTSNNLNIGFENGIHYTDPKIERGYARTRVRDGDVLVTVKGFGTGKIGIVPATFTGNITRDLARVRLNKSIDRRFFLHLWRNVAYRSYWGAASVGSTRPELSIGTLRELSVPHPDLREQARIAALLDAIEAAGLSAARRCVQAHQLLKRLADGQFSVPQS